MPKGIYRRKKSSPKKSAASVIIEERQPKTAVSEFGPSSEMMIANQPELDDYIAADMYKDLLERFHILQLELAERDLTIAKLHYEMAQEKADILRRLHGK